MRFRRSLLLVMALIVGGGLGAVLPPEFEPVKIILFLPYALCWVRYFAESTREYPKSDLCP